MTPGESRILVAASGFGPTAVAVPSDVGEPLVVTLPASNLLEILIRTPDGAPPAGIRAFLETSESPFQLDDDRALRKLLGEEGRFFRSVSASGDHVLALQPSEGGRCVLSGLKPGLAMALRVQGRFDGLVQVEEIRPLGLEEVRTVEIDLIRTPRTLSGLVLDEEGRPLVGARVIVTVPGPTRGLTSSSRGSSFGTDESGRFSIANIYAERLDLGVEKSGYTPLRFPELEIPHDDRPVEFRLAPGHEVRVIVEDEDGRRQEAQVIAMLDGGKFVFANELERGVYLLRGLPPTEVTIEAFVNQVPHGRIHDPLLPELRITVPVGGEVEALVALPAGLGPDATCSVWLIPDGPWGATRTEPVVDPTSIAPVSVVFRDVLPGRYEAVARRYVGGDGPEQTWEDVTGRAPVEVRIGQTARVDVGP